MNARDIVPSIWTTGTTEVFRTGTWRAALPQHIHAPSPCHVACPVNGDIAEWIGAAGAGDMRGAWQILTRHNPFPAIAGRICHHPCEAACNRAAFDAPLSICRLERHVGDRALAEGWALPRPAVERAQRVAVVGGGPSGLSAAFHLRRRGYAVTLFEERSELGGLMRYGIPAYRLPRAVLDGEIARIVALGIEVRCGTALATAADFAHVRASFDAVYIATGARLQKRLPWLDYTRGWVVDGADYLAQASAGAAPALGKRVVVIGGGSAAIDVARTARRAGHDVTIVALESRPQMPAQHEEVTEALEEGITLVDGAMVTAAQSVASGGLALQCTRVRFEPGAARGQFTVTPLDGTTFELDADALIPAIGQDPDLAALRDTLETNGSLLRTDERQAASLAGVYAGGDVASMARFVTEAIGMGKRAAREIHRSLQGDMTAGDEHAGSAHVCHTADVVRLDAINTFYHAATARTMDARLDPAQRLASGAEVQIALDAEQAMAEAERCFSCGTCITCDNCVQYCPDLAVQFDGAGYVVLTDYCKGCGLCVKECPTGSMRMIEEAR